MSIQKRIRNIWNKSRLNWVILVIPPKSEWNPHLNKDLIYCHFISRSIHHQISNQFQITNCGSTERNISIGRTDQNALRRWVSEKSECFPKYAFPQDNFVARVSVSLFIPYIYTAYQFHLYYLNAAGTYCPHSSSTNYFRYWKTGDTNHRNDCTRKSIGSWRITRQNHC